MRTQTSSSRRAFLKGGAVAAAPLAIAVPAAALAAEDHKARAQKLQDQAEIAALHQAWLRKLAVRADASALFTDPKAARLDCAIQGVSADHAGRADQIEVAADGLSARGRFAVKIDLQSEVPRDTTFGQMAHLQGGGTVRHAEARTLHARYEKSAGAWAIAAMELRRA